MDSKVVLTLSAMLAVSAAVIPGGGWGGWGANAGGWGENAGGWGGANAGGWGGGNAGGWGANTGVAWGPYAGVNAATGAPNVAVNPWIPPWISSAPWYPQWGPCVTIGSSCADCNTKLVCTKVGGLKRACSDPTLPHCNLGECSATPSEECAVPAAPASVV